MTFRAQLIACLIAAESAPNGIGVDSSQNYYCVDNVLLKDGMFLDI